MAAEPSPRWGHSSAAVEGQVYLYGGRTKDFTEEKQEGTLLSTAHVFDSYLESWREAKIEGTLPLGLYGSACASSGQHIYVYGGFDGTARQGSLHQLDTAASSWSLLALARAGHGPMGKTSCGLVTHGDQLVLFGGYGLSSGPTQPGAEFVKQNDTDDDSIGWSNELHSFDLKEGTWSSPAVSGTRPPPCSDFSLTKTDDHHAVLFGGYDAGRKQYTNDVYILNLTTMHWSKLDCPEGESCPMGRRNHAAVCLGYNNHPRLLVTGGRRQGTDNFEDKVLSDQWLLDVESGKWREVKEARHQAKAHHSATAFTHTPALTEVVMFGGYPEVPEDYQTDADLPPRANTTVLRFEYKKCGSTTKEWVLIDLADLTEGGPKLGTSQRVREKMAKMSHTSTAAPVATTKEEGMEEKDRRIQEAETRAQAAEERAIDAERAKVTAETRLHEIRNTLQEAEASRQEAEAREQEAEKQQQELETRIQEIHMERNQRNEVNQVQTQWMERDEIQVTGPELGRGGWATVSVATFRGVRVAAKVIHNQIVSQHNMQLFRREMDMAARIRHPNLLQFIGATPEGEMVILTELMSTSLRTELQDKNMSPKQVISISLDVARALNYLHLMRPHPLIHRDISSANVLLEPLPNNRWRAKVSDYGTVNLQEQLHTAFPGNPCYAAPEANDPTQQSPKMDIYSFGALLLEMLTGELPVSKERPRLLQKIDKQLLALIERCLSQNREDRPTASDIITELES